MDNRRKLRIIADESTKLSDRIMLVIYLRVTIANEEEIIALFFIL